jgi:2-iminobutanoate/2-iminopropanoate deaminase
MRVTTLLTAPPIGGSLLITGWFASTTAPPAHRYIAPRLAPDTTQPPFSGAGPGGDTLYLSAALGLDAERRRPDDPEVEARNVLDAIQRTLGEAGMARDDFVFVQVFCSDVRHYDLFNSVYRTYFKKEFPARALLGSGTRLFGARFEAQGIAVRR